MRRSARGNKPHLPQIEHRQGFLRQAQVAEVNRIEGAAENTDGAQGLTSNLSIAEHDEFLRGETFQPDRAARMDFVGGNTDLRA